MIVPPAPAHFTTSFVWHNFVTTYALTDLQQRQFERYLELLIEWNQFFNITAITDPEKIIQDHFYDSLALGLAYPMEHRQGLADIGSGGGLPGIPLKIKYPDVPVVLVEVTQKKIHFLNHVIEQLQLPLISVSSWDWRSFIRQKEYDIDTVCARASLRPDELVRVFTKESVYDNITVVYWASMQWELGAVERPYFDHDYEYISGEKKRKLVFFTKKRTR